MKLIYQTPHTWSDKEKVINWFKSEKNYFYRDVCPKCGDTLNRKDLKLVLYRQIGFDFTYTRCETCWAAEEMVYSEATLFEVLYVWRGSDWARELKGKV
jgi:ribosomal protein S27E